MSDKFKATVRIQRPARIQTDGGDRSGGAESFESVDFELCSAGDVKKILGSKDEAAIKAIEDAAESDHEGVLARNVATGLVEILDNSDLQLITENDTRSPKQEKGADPGDEPAFHNENSIDELSLVSTLALKRIIKEEDENAPVTDENMTLTDKSVSVADENVPVTEEINISGFDPYNSS